MKSSLKTSLYAFLGSAFFLAGHSSADTLLGGYVGAQTWQMATEGGFSQDQNLTNFTFEDENQVALYAALEHPIPLIPNIKLARTTIETSGVTSIENEFTFGGVPYIVGSEVSSEVDLDTIDYILYYEILDNDLVSIDFGISGKHVDGEIMVIGNNGDSSQERIDSIIPMGYAKIAVGLPPTGFGIYAEGSALAIDDDSFTDYQVALTYNFVETLALDITIQAGYRSTELDIKDLDNVYADLQFDGVFIGLEFDF